MDHQVVVVEEPVREAAELGRAAWRNLAARLVTTVSSNRKAAVGALLLLFFVVVALCAPLITPYNPDASDFLPIARLSISSIILGPCCLRFHSDQPVAT